MGAPRRGRLRNAGRAARRPGGDPPQPRGSRRRARRGRAARRARAAGRAVRLPPREARRSPPLGRGPRSDRADAPGLRSGRCSARAAWDARARHGHRLGDHLRAGRIGRARPERRAGLGRAALRDDRRPRGRPGRPAHAARGRALRSSRSRARKHGRGDGRLLRLRQGRRLRRRGLGDLPGAGGARRRRTRGRRRAHDLPRPRRQRRARRRAHPRRDPRPGAGPSAGPPQGDRAGRDDLVQVRPAGDGVPQPGVGARRDGAERIPTGRRTDARAGRAPTARRARRARGGAVPLACLADARLRRLLPRLHAGGRAGAARSRLAPRAPARQRRLPRLVARDPVGVRLDAEPDAAAGVVRLRNRSGDRRARPAARPASQTFPSSARSSTTSR